MTKFTSMNTRNKLREISDTRINYAEIRIQLNKLIQLDSCFAAKQKMKSLQSMKHLFNQTNELLYFHYKSFPETLLYFMTLKRISTNGNISTENNKLITSSLVILAWYRIIVDCERKYAGLPLYYREKNLVHQFAATQIARDSFNHNSSTCLTTRPRFIKYFDHHVTDKWSFDSLWISYAGNK